MITNIIPLQLFKSYCAECDKFYKNNLSHSKNISWKYFTKEANEMDQDTKLQLYQEQVFNLIFTTLSY